MYNYLLGRYEFVYSCGCAHSQNVSRMYANAEGKEQISWFCQTILSLFEFFPFFWLFFLVHAYSGIQNSFLRILWYLRLLQLENDIRFPSMYASWWRVCGRGVCMCMCLKICKPDSQSHIYRSSFELGYISWKNGRAKEPSERENRRAKEKKPSCVLSISYFSFGILHKLHSRFI